MQTKDELLSRIRELEQENQRLRESLEHKDKLLDQCIQGLAEFNKMVFSSEQENDYASPNELQPLRRLVPGLREETPRRKRGSP